MKLQLSLNSDTKLVFLERLFLQIRVTVQLHENPDDCPFVKI